MGYSAAWQNEAAASEDEQWLIEVLFTADVTSLCGIVAKLDVLIAIGADGAEGRHFPWPELRRIRRDVALLVELQRQQRIAFTA